MPEDSSDDGGDYVELTEVDSIWDGEMEAFDVGEEEVLVLKVDGQVRAYDGICPHQSISLVEGDLEGGVLTCRAHEYQFDALTGDGVNPTGIALRRHDVDVDDRGVLRVRLCSRDRSSTNMS
jgi:nitrite reductase/ring-hydroxylating ferredoxin subunit